MANENYDRIEIELTNLRRRVSELEHSNQDLQRKYYEMKTYVRGLEMEAYLKDYKPKETIHKRNEKQIRQQESHIPRD